MTIIALDTCTECCSAALLYQGEVFECVEMTQRGHSDLILGMLDNVLQQAGITMAEIDVLAFGQGPGSFTGVRVGVAVAQGIAFARELPVVGVSSLAAVAQSAADSLNVDHLAVAMDARMGEIYCAHYQRQANGVVELIDKAQVCPPEQFKPEQDQQGTGVGTGWREYKDVLSTQFAQQLATINADYYPQAKSIIKLAQVEIAAGNILTADQAMPVYLRNNVAKKKGEQ